MSALYVLDLIGVAIFAASGALAGMASNLDLLGVLVLASATAVGGGTIRDVLLNRHPIFWTKDPGPIFAILGATALTVIAAHRFPVPIHALVIADAFGLALFAITGAEIAEACGCKGLVTILMGTLTGSGGGVMRDLLSARVPLILRQDIYASAAIAGITVYLSLSALKVPTSIAWTAGFVTVVGIRLAAIAFDWRLPVLGLPT